MTLRHNILLTTNVNIVAQNEVWQEREDFGSVSSDNTNPVKVVTTEDQDWGRAPSRKEERAGPFFKCEVDIC